MRASELLKWVESGMYAQWLQSDPSEQPQEAEQPENVKDSDFLGNW